MNMAISLIYILFSLHHMAYAISKKGKLIEAQVRQWTTQEFSVLFCTTSTSLNQKRTIQSQAKDCFRSPKYPRLDLTTNKEEQVSRELDWCFDYSLIARNKS